jgi:phage gp29-like protein
MADKKPSDKIIVNNYSAWYKYIGMLPDPYKELKDYNIYELFRNMRKYDSHVKAAYTQRLFNAAKKRWSIEPASESAEDIRRAEVISENLKQLETKDFFKNLLSAVPDGFAVLELSYDYNDDGYIHITKAKHIFPERFGFNEDGELLLKDPAYAPTLKKGSGLYINLSKREPMKFIVHSNGGEFSDPSGAAVLAACYWPWTMKKLGLGNWTKLLERFGVPSIAAFFKDTGNDEQKEARRVALVEQVQNIHDGAAGAFTDVEELKIIEANGADSAGFLDFCRFMNNEISKAFLTETLTLETQGVGSFALGEKHFDIVEEWITEQDVTSLQYTLNNTLIKWLYALNWGDADQCHIQFNLEQKADVKDVQKFMELGVVMSKEKLKNDYYLPIAEEGEDPAVEPQAAVELSKKKDQLNPYS